MTYSKLQAPKTWLIFVLKGITSQKKLVVTVKMFSMYLFVIIVKTDIACFNTNLFSLYYEPWHIYS